MQFQQLFRVDIRSLLQKDCFSFEYWKQNELVYLKYLWMAQLLHLLEWKEEHIIGRIDGAGDTVNRMRYGNTSAKYWIVFNIINSVRIK